MKICYLVVALLLIPPSVFAQARYTQQQVVDYGKALDVAKLDPTLSSQRLDEWLRSGPAHVETAAWKMHDCHVNKVSSKHLAPLCVEVSFTRGTIDGWLIIMVGTVRQGIEGTPHIDELWAVPQKDGAPRTNRLSDLPKFLDEASSFEKEVVSYAKALDVAKLDPTLSPQRLDEWLRSGPAHVETVKWETSDCDLMFPPSPAPLCVRVRVARGDGGAWILITVGTYRDGANGAHHLEVVYAGFKNGSALDSDKLSDLPRLLDEASSLRSDRQD